MTLDASMQEQSAEEAPQDFVTPAEPAARSRTGDVRFHEEFQSRYLGQRSLSVYLPPDYESEPEARYPVLYLHDGQNLFDEATSFGEEWRVDETVERLIRAGEIEPLIVVGIPNGGDARIAEYTPTRSEEHPGSGRADRHGLMLIEEIKPFIDARYRTLSGPQHTGIGGSSLGGLVSLYVALKYAGIFWRVAAISPSVWWDDRFLLRRVRAVWHRLPSRVWLSAGTEEGAEAVEGVTLLRDALLEHERIGADALAFELVEGAGHDEPAWRAVLEHALRFLYPPAVQPLR